MERPTRFAMLGLLCTGLAALAQNDRRDPMETLQRQIRIDQPYRTCR